MPKVEAVGQASGGRGRRARAFRVSTSLSEINVVPLVDVMLVLLIIFMVTAPMMQQGIDVTLPQSRRGDPLQDERLFITVPLSFQTDQHVTIGDEAVPLDALAERIRQALLSDDEKDVFLRGDGGVRLQELMQVIDRLKEAGVEKVGVVSRPEADR